MSDLHLKRTEQWDFDLEFDGQDLVLANDMETAIIISLFTWARRASEDLDPTPGGDQMGWWADETLEPSGDFLGGKIWLSQRSKITPDLVLQLDQWGSDALDWMIQDGLADSVDLTVERSATESDRVDIQVQAKKGGQIPANYRYELNWEAQTSRRS
jgi:phage gp46-like protein